MLKAKQPWQPIDNPPVNGMRWYPPQITSQFADEKAFVDFWKDKDVYPEITDAAKREAVLKLAWKGALQNIADNEKAGTPIVVVAEKKK